MQFRQFTTKLEEAGWEAMHDAQYQHIFQLWEVLFPDDYRMSQLEATIMDLENELEGLRMTARQRG